LSNYISKAEIEKAASFVRGMTDVQPQIGLVTGSGLAELANRVSSPVCIPFRQIPHFVQSSVEGHPGELVIGALQGKSVAILRGRVHFYEGYSMQQVTFPIRVLRALGVETLIVTNAAGGLNPSFRAGDLMLITDHLNLLGMAGFNPLIGPNDPTLGPRFPVMDHAYDPGLRQLARKVAQRLGFKLQEGVYVMLAGPSFESPADVRFLRRIGADAVGMSTVAEVIVARHGGMRVLGLSVISNVLSGEHETPPEVTELHGEVLAAGQAAVPRLAALIEGIIQNQ